MGGIGHPGLWGPRRAERVDRARRRIHACPIAREIKDRPTGRKRSRTDRGPCPNRHIPARPKNRDKRERPPRQKNIRLRSGGCPRGIAERPIDLGRTDRPAGRPEAQPPRAGFGRSAPYLCTSGKLGAQRTADRSETQPTGAYFAPESPYRCAPEKSGYGRSAESSATSSRRWRCGVSALYL